MPGAAARLADVCPVDPHPLVPLGGPQHFAEQLPVRGLDPRALDQVASRLGGAIRQAVPDPLQITEPQNPRPAGRGRDGGVDRDPPEAVADQSGELGLELADLAAQLAPPERLVYDG